MVRWVVAALLAVVCTTTQAEQRISFGGWSHHLFTSVDYHETHNLLVYEKDDLFGGRFTNSFNEESYILGKVVWKKDLTRYWEAYLIAGMIYGYRDCFEPVEDTTSKNVCPALIPGTRYKRWRLEPDLKLVANAVEFNLNWRF